MYIIRIPDGLILVYAKNTHEFAGYAQSTIS